jgi:hypothetical protein
MQLPDNFAANVTRNVGQNVTICTIIRTPDSSSLYLP